MSNANSSLGETEYTKLLMSDEVDKRILEHPRFRSHFINMYDMIMGWGNFEPGKQPNVTVSIYNGAVSISTQHYLPDATNGEYKGYKEASSHVFKIVDFHGEEHLCVEEKRDTIFVKPQDISDIGSNSVRLTVFKGYEEVGNFNFMRSYPAAKSVRANLSFACPEYSIGYAISGTLPPISPRADYGEISMTCAGRNFGSGVINATRATRTGQYPGKYEVETGLASISYEHPEDIRFNGNFNIAYQGSDGEWTFDKTKYTSVNEARATVEAAYQEFRNIKQY